jgi:hypothetical protein
MVDKNLYYNKYLKYKNKYLDLKNQTGGVITRIEKFEYEQLEEVIFPNIQEGDENDILIILEYLKFNPNLKRLTFRNITQILDNPLFEAFFLPLLRDIFIKKNIEYLNISGNKEQNIQLEDRHIIILAKILKNCDYFEEIDLNNNNITIKGFNELISALQQSNEVISALQQGNDVKYVKVILKGNPIIDTIGLGWREILRREQELIYIVYFVGITLILR